ncbi:hypothetical protein ACWEPL_64660, partial [Nonomuraea sp. NPDC004186]
MRRRFLLVMLAVAMAGTGMTAPAPALADPVSPSPAPSLAPSPAAPSSERHTISVGRPADRKTARVPAATALAEHQYSFSPNRKKTLPMVLATEPLR